MLNFIHNDLEFFLIYFGVPGNIFKNLAGKPADEHQGVLDFMADMGCRSPQGRQAFTA